MATRFVGLLEKTTHVYSAVIKDEANDVVPAAQLTTLTLTQYALQTGTIINSREGQNVLNANNVTVTSGGVLTWIMQPADNAIVNAALEYEFHIALFEWTYASGAKAGKHEVEFKIQNLTKVA